MAAGRTIGSVNFIVGMDGKALPAEARASGEEAGLAASEGFDESFNKSFGSIGEELAANMKKNGELSGSTFSDALASKIRGSKGQLSSELANIFGDTDGLDNFFGKFPTIDEAVDTLRGKIGQLSDAQGLSNEEFNRIGGVLDDYIPKAREAAATQETFTNTQRESAAAEAEHSLSLRRLGIDLADQVDHLNRVHEAFQGFDADGKRLDSTVEDAVPSLDKLDKELTKVGNNNSFGNGMSTNAKQVIAIIVAIAAGAPEIASLGSLIGSSALIGVGALGVLVAGVAVAISSFTQLASLTGKLPAGVLASQKAFSGLTGEVTKLRTLVSENFFADMAGPLNGITTALQKLTPAFEAFARQAGSAVGLVATAISSPAFQGGLTTFLTAAGPAFTTITQAAISFGGAISNLFIASLPFVQLFANGIAQIGAAFLTWTQSDAGRAAITTFLEHGQQLIGPLLGLVGSLATSLASLVTPQAIAMTGGLLTNLAQFLPVLASILSAIGGLNLFGVAVSLLNQFGQAITPILPALSTLANTLGGVLIQAATALAPALGQILDALVPLAISIVNSLLPAITPILGLLSPIASVFGQLATVMEPLGTQVGTLAASIITGLLPAIVPIINLLPQLIQPFVDLSGVLIAQLVPILPPLIQLVAGLLEAITPLLPTLIPLISDGLEGLVIALQVVGPIITGVAGYLNEILVPAVKLISDVLGGLITFLTDVFEGKWSAAWTSIGNTVGKVWDDVKSVVQGGISGTIDLVNGLIRGINAVTGAVGIPKIPLLPAVHLAAGGIVNGSTFAEIGEAGAEAVVPLTRPLSQVNPEVRDLAAFARGEGPDSGVGGQTVQHNWLPGSVQVITPAEDPTIVAETVVDSIIAGL